MSLINFSGEILISSQAEQQKSQALDNFSAEKSTFQKLMNDSHLTQENTAEKAIKGIKNLASFLELESSLRLKELTQSISSLSNVSFNSISSESFQAELSQEQFTLQDELTKQEELIIWVPLKSIATGKLVQTQSHSFFELINHLSPSCQLAVKTLPPFAVKNDPP